MSDYTLQDVESALHKAHEAGDTKSATILANELKIMTTPVASEETNPDEAGLENIPYVGPLIRAVAQPLYEGAVVANIVAEAPAFVGGEVAQLWNTADIYFDSEINAKSKETKANDIKVLAQEAKALQDAGKPVPPQLQEALVNLDSLQGSGISFSEASKLAGQKSDKFVKDYLSTGAISDTLTSSIVDATITDPDENNKAKQMVLDAQKAIKENEYIPSSNTVMNETILGKGLQAFGWVLGGLSDGLTALGVPEDTSDALVNLASLAAGPKFNKAVSTVKSKTGYTAVYNKVYGDLPAKGIKKATGIDLSNILAKTDRTKMEQEFSNMKLQMESYNKKPKSVPGKTKKERQQEYDRLETAILEAENLLYNERGQKNTDAYGMFDQAKPFAKWDSVSFDRPREMSNFELTSTRNSDKKIKALAKKLDNTEKGLETFKELVQYSATAGNKANKVAGVNLINRMQSLFGKSNGYKTGRQMSDVTIKDYADVVDVIQGTKRRTDVAWDKKKLELEFVMKNLLDESYKNTKRLQKLGKIDKFPLTKNIFPRRFHQDKPAASKLLFGDTFQIKYGDRVPTQKKVISDNIYYKLVHKDGKGIDIPITLTMSKSGQFAGKPAVAVNRAFFKKDTKQVFKYQTEPNGGGSKQTQRDGQLAAQISSASKNLNKGQGLKNPGDTFMLNGKQMVMEPLTRKEFADTFKKETITDPLAALVDAVAEQRQQLRSATFGKEVLKSAFGKRNFREITQEGSRSPTPDGLGLYDPKFPNKNIAKFELDIKKNQGFETNAGQLKEMKIDLDAVGLQEFKGYKASERAGDILFDNFRIYENKSLLGKISDALVKNMMLNPIPHMHNELIHYYSTLGATKSAKASGAGLWNVMFGKKDQVTKWSKDGEWAQRQVLERTPEYIKLIESGMSSMSANVINSKGWAKVMQQGTDTFWKPNKKISWLGDKGYKAAEGYGRISDFAQYSMWTVRDIMYMQLAKQKMDNTNKVRLNAWRKQTGGKGTPPQKIDLLEAAKQVELHMPTYRLPETVGSESVLGYKITRNIARALSNPDWVIFARYKHGMVSSGLNTMKDTLSVLDPVLSKTGKVGQFTKNRIGYENIKLKRTAKEQAMDGIDSGLALGTAMYMIYPMMDALYEELFDGDEVKIRRAGVLHVLETFGKAADETAELHNVRQVLLTINPALMLAYELMMNNTIYNDQAIYNMNDLFGSGNIENFAGDIGTKLLQTVPQASNLIHAKDDYEKFDLDKALGRQFDAKIKTRAQTLSAQKRKAMIDNKNLNEAMENGEDLDPYLQEYWENNDYWAN